MNQTRIVHCKKEPYDVYIGRPSKWGNPFRVGVHGSREEVVEKYRKWVNGEISAPDGSTPPTVAEMKHALQGKTLGCWCKPKLCHGDVIVDLVEGVDNA